MSETKQDVEGPEEALLDAFEDAVGSMECSENAKETQAEINEARGALLGRFRTLRDQVERLSEQGQVLCEDCGDTGWLENRVEGRYPCTCLAETEPWQAMEARVAELEADRERLMGEAGETAQDAYQDGAEWRYRNPPEPDARHDDRWAESLHAFRRWARSQFPAAHWVHAARRALENEGRG